MWTWFGRVKGPCFILQHLMAKVCVGTLGWWSLGWAIAYGSKEGTKLFGTDGWFGEGFYTKDSSGDLVRWASIGCDIG